MSHHLPDHAVILSIGLGGYDGVSVEAERWMRALQRLGLTVTRAAGHFYDTATGHHSTPHDIHLPSLWRPLNTDGTFGPTPNVTTHELDTLGAAVDGNVLIIDNAATLPTAPHSIRTLLDRLPGTPALTILRHHDPEWDSPTYRNTPSHGFPLNPPGSVHVAISTHVQTQLHQRRGITSTVIHNAVDIPTPTPDTRAKARTRHNIHPDDLVLLHPVTPYPRKNVPAALDFATRLANTTHRRVIYWLTGADPTNPPTTPGVTTLTGRATNPTDMYAAADAVLLPSTWEGWGNPVTEAAYLNIPVLTGHWPALDDMRTLGVHDIPITHADAAHQLLDAINTHPGHHTHHLHDRLSTRTLDQALTQLLSTNTATTPLAAA